MKKTRRLDSRSARTARWLNMPRKRAIVAGAAIFAAALTGLFFRDQVKQAITAGSAFGQKLTKSVLAEALIGRTTEAGVFEQFPTEVELMVGGVPTEAIVQYAFDPRLQHEMEGLFRQYRPDYGAFVAIDASTGRVVSMVSYIHDKADATYNMALKSSFPSASIFKVVTAAAAIAENNYSADTRISFNGRNHTLYRNQVLKLEQNRWTRSMSLRDAFAQSVNTVFGKIGFQTVGAQGLRMYADRFGFNRQIVSDVQIGMGRAPIKDDPWALAESASGFTRENTMSPLQGALIAAAISNDGIMMEPYVVETVHSHDGAIIYGAQPKISSVTVDPSTAAEVRALMRETVKRGTSRGSFRRFFRGNLAGLDVGGKTGSLTGVDPKGKYDWFVGFAQTGSRRIAVAALTVHKEYWRVKSSYLARRAFEAWYKDHPAGDRVAASRP